MEFTREERKACLYMVMQLADCDGPRTRNTLDSLVEISNSLGITTEDLLQGFITEAYRLHPEYATNIVLAMEFDKKLHLEQSLSKIMEANGGPSDKQLYFWNAMEEMMKLPYYLSKHK